MEGTPNNQPHPYDEDPLAMPPEIRQWVYDMLGEAVDPKLMEYKDFVRRQPGQQPAAGTELAELTLNSRMPDDVTVAVTLMTADTPMRRGRTVKLQWTHGPRQAQALTYTENLAAGTIDRTTGDGSPQPVGLKEMRWLADVISAGEPVAPGDFGNPNPSGDQ